MASPESDGLKPPKTAKTPAFVPVNQLPPRINAPGILWFGWPPLSPGPPKQLTSPPARPVWLVQSVQLCLISAQSATHSSTLPTMSNAPHFETQAERAPVLAGFGELVTHVVAPSSAFPGSGVPAAASCHSRFVRSRFAESAHACAAWNQSMHVLGSTPGMDTAYTPGEGGSEPKTGAHWPPAGKFVGYAVAFQGADGQPSWTAPPASRSASVTVPCCTLAMSAVFPTAICQTLASYLSTQVSPTRTASGGHDRTGLLTLAASAPTFAASVLTDASTTPTRVGSVPRSVPTSTAVSFFLQAVSRRKISPRLLPTQHPRPGSGGDPREHARQGKPGHHRRLGHRSPSPGGNFPRCRAVLPTSERFYPRDDGGVNGVLRPMSCARPPLRSVEWPGSESNQRHRDFQSRALPTELPGPSGTLYRLPAAPSNTARCANRAP